MGDRIGSIVRGRIQGELPFSRRLGSRARRRPLSPTFAFHPDANERPVSDVDPSFDQKMATGRNGSSGATGRHQPDVGFRCELAGRYAASEDCNGSGTGVDVRPPSGRCTFVTGHGNFEIGRLDPARSRPCHSLPYRLQPCDRPEASIDPSCEGSARFSSALSCSPVAVLVRRRRRRLRHRIPLRPAPRRPLSTVMKASSLWSSR